MGLPNLDLYCQPNTVSSRACITVPGGAEICAYPADGTIPDPSKQIKALFGQVNAALAPLVPIFDIIDCVVALTNCIKAVQKAIASVPPQPQKLAQCIPELADRLSKLLKLVPQLSIPALVGSFLDALILYFQGVRLQLIQVAKKQLFILQGNEAARELGTVALTHVLECSQRDVDDYLLNLNSDSEAIGRMLLIINSLLQMAGLDPIPGSSDLMGNVDEIAVGIDATIKALQAIRPAFP